MSAKKIFTKKRKKNFIIICSIALALLVGIVIFFIANKDDGVKDMSTPAEYETWIYQVDDWKEKDVEQNDVYYKTLLIYSKDYYDEPSTDDIRYLTNNGYEGLTDVVENSSITIYTMNATSKTGVCTYVKIKTNEMLDEKKIYANVEGPVEYIEGVSKKEDFVKKYKSEDGWCGLMVSVSDFMVPTDEVGPIQPSREVGVITLSNDEETTRCYYQINSENATIKNNTIMKSMVVDELHENGLEEFVKILPSCYTANVVDGEVQVVQELNENIKIKCEVVDNVLWYGYETVNGDNISTYIDELPKYIIATAGNYLNMFQVTD